MVKRKIPRDEFASNNDISAGTVTYLVEEHRLSCITLVAVLQITN
jgi:hypothetical protein